MDAIPAMEILLQHLSPGDASEAFIFSAATALIAAGAFWLRARKRRDVIGVGFRATGSGLRL
jgi:hypothetical protein